MTSSKNQLVWKDCEIWGISPVKLHDGRPNTSLMVLTACNCVTRSSQANFVLKSCLAQVIFGALLSGLCAPRGSPFCCWYSTIWSLHPLTAGQAKEMKEEGGGRREEGQEDEQLGRGDQITDAIPANYLDGCDRVFRKWMAAEMIRGEPESLQPNNRREW